MLVVIPVCHHHRVIVVIFVRLSLGSVDNQWCSQSIDVLTLVVPMQPVCSPLLWCILATLWRVEDLVVERVSVWDGALRHARCTIVVVHVREEQTVSVQRRRPSIAKLVRKVDVDKVVRVDTQRIRRKLAIDADGSARELSIWVHIIDPADTLLLADFGAKSRRS